MSQSQQQKGNKHTRHAKLAKLKHMRAVLATGSQALQLYDENIALVVDNIRILTTNVTTMAQLAVGMALFDDDEQKRSESYRFLKTIKKSVDELQEFNCLLIKNM